MSDNEIEDVSFLPGASLHRKAVYEPSIVQRIKQQVCTKTRLAVLSVITCLLILVLALLIALSNNSCQKCGPPSEPQLFITTTPKSSGDDFISTNGKPFPYKKIRLPHNVIPVHYNLFIHPNISKSYFKGTVEIECEVKQSTSYIVFHIKDLNITALSVTNVKDGRAYSVHEHLEYTKRQQVYVDLGQRLSPGSNVKVKVEYEGHLIMKLAGFYKSMYVTNSGEKRYIATTHFEPTDARAAFPCFDEPALKATFELTMVRDKDHKTLFNMPLHSTSDYKDGLVQDKFEKSVKMSTYLVAFIVSDYDSITDKTKRGITVGVHAPHDSIGAASFALQAAVKIIDYYEEFFGVNYPLPKQDLVAIPDFAAGAMENWGLITYRMTAILYDPKVATAKDKQWVAVVIAHELAHQWFGNLVTMAWWDDLWLNEGFASFVEYVGSSIVNPDWKMEDQFVYNTLLNAEYLDSLHNSHRINLPVENPDQINELFDTITYDKGASIIRMLSNFMGKEKFKAGLTAYLNRYRFNNAVTADLWSSLSEATSKSDLNTTVNSMMRTWTEQMGYPLITLKKQDNVVTVTQSRFLLYNQSGESSAEKYQSPFGYLWEVPFTYKTSKEPSKVKKKLLKDKAGSFSIEAKTSWVKGNPEMYGYYRVNYDKDGWKAIISELNRYNKTFSVPERAGLIDDAFMLARAGLLDYDTFFTLTTYMVQEDSYLPWKTFLANMGYVQWRIENKPIYVKYKKFMLNLMKNRLKDITWADTGSTLDKYLRAAIIVKGVRLGHESSVAKGRQYFQDWKKNHSSININLKSAIYLAGVVYGNEQDWNTVWEAYQVETDPSEKRKLLEVLGTSRDARLLMRLLSYSMNTSLVRSQDTDSVIEVVAGSPAGQVLAWRFVQQNWDEIMKRYADTSFILSKLIKSCLSGFDTQFDYDEVKRFFSTRDAATGNRAVQQTLEKIQMNIEWSNNFEEKVIGWLEKHVI